MKRIGILGAGQLGRMLALAGYPLGLQFRFFDPAPSAPAELPGPRIRNHFDDSSALEKFAREVDLVTYEFENVPVESAQFLERFIPVYPPPRALEVSQDRLVEKQFLSGLGVGTAPYTGVESLKDLQAGLDRTGLPAILKTRRFGYDGKGQAVVTSAAEAADAFGQLGEKNLILEGFVRFESELSIISVRSGSGEVVFYPLVENTHREGILRRTVAPAPNVSPLLQRKAEEYARAALEEMDYVGTLAIELFQVGDDLIANEMAPRVHNSGHWTIEGAFSSQFENHLRATLGLPLGSTEVIQPSTMLNLIGTSPPLAPMLKVPGAHVHLYDKTSRPGRKLGHVTVCSADQRRLQESVRALERLIERP